MNTFSNSAEQGAAIQSGNSAAINTHDDDLVQYMMLRGLAPQTAQTVIASAQAPNEVDAIKSRFDEYLQKNIPLAKIDELLLAYASELDRMHRKQEKFDKAVNKEAKEQAIFDSIEFWSKRGIECDEKGKPLDTVETYRKFISALPGITLRTNEVTGFREINGNNFTDNDFSELLDECTKNRLFRERYLEHALNIIFDKNKYNPLKEKFDSLTWDGTARATRIFIDYLGVENTPLNQKMTFIWLYAAVKRALEPGCKFDQVLIIQGPQGTGKSLMFDRLSFGMACNNPDISTKDGLQRMHRSWFVIWDELVSLGKKDSNEAKNFISESYDVFRAPYAKSPDLRKRHFVFCGTTNDENFLKDYSGKVERRFWVMKATRSQQDNIVFDRFTNEVVEQVWAEVYMYYKNNMANGIELPLILLDKDYEDFAKKQEEFKAQAVDSRFAHIEAALALEYPRFKCSKEDDVEKYKLVDDHDFCKIALYRFEPENNSSENGNSTSNKNGNPEVGRVDVFPKRLIEDMLAELKFNRKEMRGLVKAFAEWNSETWEYRRYGKGREYCLVRKDEQDKKTDSSGKSAQATAIGVPSLSDNPDLTGASLFNIMNKNAHGK